MLYEPKPKSPPAERMRDEKYREKFGVSEKIGKEKVSQPAEVLPL